MARIQSPDTLTYRRLAHGRPAESAWPAPLGPAVTEQRSVRRHAYFRLAPGSSAPGGPAGGALGIEVRGPVGQLGLRAGPASPAAWAWIAARAGQLVTVLAVSGGGSWRVIAEPVRYRARRIPFGYGAEGFSLVITSTAGPGVAGMLVVGLDWQHRPGHRQAWRHLPCGERCRDPGRCLPGHRADPHDLCGVTGMGWSARACPRR